MRMEIAHTLQKREWCYFTFCIFVCLFTCLFAYPVLCLRYYVFIYMVVCLPVDLFSICIID